MQKDFHYYATYCAAVLAGYSHAESLEICYSAQYVDCCTKTLLDRLHGPKAAATTQLQLELMNARTDPVGLQDITRIWASFHFLPFDLNAPVSRRPKRYVQKYRLLCNSDGPLVADTVNLAKDKSLQAVGIAMHVLADTWAHKHFAGTPSLVLNNTNDHFFELLPGADGTVTRRRVVFRHDPSSPDDLEKGLYTNSVYYFNENSIMNLGHGRAGHLPDYSFIRYRYLPAWGDYLEIIKDNPSDYYHAFCQMIYAMKFLRGAEPSFVTRRYDFAAAEPYAQELRSIIERRRLDASKDWRALGERLSGREVPDFVLEQYEQEYLRAPKEEKNGTFLGKFFLAALAQKSMVTGKIFRSGNRLAGYSVDYAEKGFKGIRDYLKLLEQEVQGGKP